MGKKKRGGGSGGGGGSVSSGTATVAAPAPPATHEYTLSPTAAENVARSLDHLFSGASQAAMKNESTAPMSLPYMDRFKGSAF